MKKTYKRVPFDIEFVKKIQSGEIEGKIVEVITKKFTYNSHGCIAIDQKVDKFIELPEKAPNFIDAKSLYDNWQYIQNILNDLFREKASKNNVKISDLDLVGYAADLFTWFRETHLIFKFKLDNLEELKQYAEKHILDPLWCNEAKQNIKKIFGLETSKNEFKIGDVVTFLEGELKDCHGVIREINSNGSIDVVIYSCDVLTSVKRISKVYNHEEKHEFKPFDKVLVRNKNKRWYPRFYAETDGLLYYTTDSKNWEECIPYEENEELVGTTNMPKENKR